MSNFQHGIYKEWEWNEIKIESGQNGNAKVKMETKARCETNNILIWDSA